MAFGYFFGFPTFNPGPVIPTPVDPDPVVGDIWEWKGKPIGDMTTGRQVQIDSVLGGQVLAHVIDGRGTRARAWPDVEGFKDLFRRVVWQIKPGQIAPRNMSRYPHACTRCGSPAYLGGGPSDVDCSNWACSTKNASMKLDRIGDLR